jgi:hypothetical protein
MDFALTADDFCKTLIPATEFEQVAHETGPTGVVPPIGPLPRHGIDQAVARRRISPRRPKAPASSGSVAGTGIAVRLSSDAKNV